MAIVFGCPKCRAEIQVPDAVAGKKGRCPQCQAKLRVPLVTPPPAVSMAIEFACPACRAAIRVPADAAGKKGSCPACQQRVQVPQMAASEVSLLPVNTPLMVLDAPAEPSAAANLRRKQRAGRGGWLVPAVCLGVVAAILGWLIYKPPVRLAGTLTGTALDDYTPPAIPLEDELTGLSRGELKSLVAELEYEPVRMDTRTMRLSLAAEKGKPVLIAEAGPDGHWVRVDPRSDRTLTAWLIKERETLDAPRVQELRTAVPKLIAAVRTARERKQPVSDLTMHRESAGLAVLEQTLGYLVHAISNKTAYRCAFEDSSGRLYFLLPEPVKSFQLKGRELKPQGIVFPGDYTVRVAAPAKPSKSSRPKRTAQPDTEDEPASDSETGMDEMSDDGDMPDDDGMSGDTSASMSDSEMMPSKSKPKKPAD